MEHIQISQILLQAIENTNPPDLSPNTPFRYTRWQYSLINCTVGEISLVHGKMRQNGESL